MSHIVIIIDRKAPPPGGESLTAGDGEAVVAHVEYTPSDAASEQEVAQNMRRLYRQVRNLGTDNG